MPPKRKAEPVSVESSPSKTKAARADAGAADCAAAAGTGSVDPNCKVSGAALCRSLKDGAFLDAMCNQTDLKSNANKFYVAQLVASGNDHYVFTRWGRVGESGAVQLNGPLDREQGEKEFKKKFKDKTANDWDNRGNFVPKPGKYDLVILDPTNKGKAADNKPAAAPVASTGTGGSKTKKKTSTLEPKTQELLEWILCNDMFKNAMQAVNIDVNKMPLGNLSKDQVKKGFEVLQEIDDALKAKTKDSSLIADLSGRFYTIVPHNFGRQRPTPIDTVELLQQKFDLVAMLGDIEIAQGIQASGSDGIDDKYAALKAKLTLLKSSDPVYQKIQKYIEATGQGHGTALLDVWACDREGEAARFKQHDKLDNRRLLWHGTNVAVVAAVLQTGLRIMPTASSGSRVGRGIYLASEHSKSAGYVRAARAPNGETHGLMFLCEAAMGKMKEITMDDSSLTCAPAGFDSVLAKGKTEPDPTEDTTIELDGKEILVPQGKAVATGVSSNFSQSEYLVYKESQNRIRYVLRFKF